jgi:hypothetical protein
MSDQSYAGRVGMSRRAGFAGALMIAVVSGCGTSPQALPTSTPPPSATPTSTPTPEPTSTPEPEPAPTPSPTRQAGEPIPAGAMLRGTDIGREYTTTDDPRMVHNDHGRLGMLLAYCGEVDFGPPYESIQAERTRTATDGPGAKRRVAQSVERHARGNAARYLAGLRSVLPKCRKFFVQANPKAESTLTVVGSGEYGDDSLLLRHNGTASSGQKYVEYHAVVRQGDVAMTVRIDIGATESQARALVRRLADRLCTATPTC